MFQTFLIAWRNLWAHRVRTLLLGGAIATVTMLLLILLGLSNGMQENMLRSATTLMTGHVNVAGFYKVHAGQSAPVVTDYKKIEDIVTKTVGSDLDFITSRGRGWAKLVSDTGAIQTGIAGVDIDREKNLRNVIIPVAGSLDSLKQPKTILIFEDQAKRLEVKVGDQLTISAPTLRGTSNTIDVTVGAIARDVGLLSKFNTYVPNDTLRQLYQLNTESTGALHVYLKDMKKVPDVAERLRKALLDAGYQMMDRDARAFWMKFEVVNREDWTGQKLDITVWDDEISFTKWTLTAIAVLTAFLTIALLFVIAIGIMNTMAIAIRERTREIGTLRAIGMQRGQVLRMFLAEGFLLGVIGAGSGALLGLLVSALLNGAGIHVPLAVQLFLMSDTVHVAIQVGSIVFTIVFITACISVISLIPSYLASRLRPVTAMHHIG